MIPTSILTTRWTVTGLALALLALAPVASADDDVPPPTAWVCSGDLNECA